MKINQYFFKRILTINREHSQDFSYNQANREICEQYCKYLYFKYKID